MTPDHIDALTAEIAAAETHATQAAPEEAAKHFDRARAMVVEFADQNALSRTIDTEKSGLTAERERYRRINADHVKAEGRKRVLVLGDSLGLPRPERMASSVRGAEITYG